MSKNISYDEKISQTIFPKLRQGKLMADSLMADGLISDSLMSDSLKIPDFILQNLYNQLRPYQNEAITNLLLVNNQRFKKILKLEVDARHNIFHMATGSGKTLVMAATMLYLYSIGYRKFLFLTQSLNLIEKTKNNLLPLRGSPKLEFTKKIMINGREVIINEVDQFSDNQDDIEISFKTVQAVHVDIQVPKENSIDYSLHNVILLADEAHHFQAKQKGNAEIDEKTWESSIDTILNTNSKNRLYEFTATLELSHSEIHEKYKNKLIYDYPLLSFRKEGYSKEVDLVKMPDIIKDRVLIALITSQYRLHVASEYGISLSPKVLFKTQGTIEQLDQFKKDVSEYIARFSVDELQSLMLKYSTYKVFKFLQKDFIGISRLEEFVSSFKTMLGSESMISIHSKNPKNEKEKLLKELNRIDENKSLRLIFAINILNEGWDVLSLFDILKMDSINISMKETTQEAQLIGRGARQFPYDYHNKDRYKRKFDGEIQNKLRLMEEMFFYSVNDNKYIGNLRQSLIDIGLQDVDAGDEKAITKKVSQLKKLENFLGVKGSPKIFTNRLLDLESSLTRIPCYFSGKKTILSIEINLELGEEILLERDANSNKNSDNMSSVKISELIIGNEFIFQRVIRKLDLINKGSNSYESYQSLLTDLFNKEFNENIELKLSNGKDGYAALKYEDKFNVTLLILNKIAEHIQKYKGKMYGSDDLSVIKSINEIFTDYTKSEKFCLEYGQNSNSLHLNAHRESLRNQYCIKNKELFYYDKVTWDSEEELELYQYLDKNIPKKEFSNILIIRNENENFKVYSTERDINSDNIGKGFCPDFIVLKRVGHELQIFFIEVKGRQDTEEWKKKLITNLLKGKTKEVDGVAYVIIGIDEFCTSENRDALIKNSGMLQSN